MHVDLPVDQVKAALRLGYLRVDGGGKLGQQVAMLHGSRLGIQVQLRDFTGKQHVPFGLQVGDVALCVPYLPRDAKKLGSGTFACDRSIDFKVIVKQTLAAFPCRPGCMPGWRGPSTA